MSKTVKMLCVCAVAIVLNPAQLFAYLDPGTGSMLFSAIIGVLATLLFVGKTLLFKVVHVKDYLRGSSVRSKKHHSIVFYSEGNKYWNVFKPVIEECISRELTVHYISSDSNDQGLRLDSSFVTTQYVPEGGTLFLLLNTLDAKMVITTTPGLDVFQLKRSKGVAHYCHITHSAGGCGGYRVFGLDYFDSVMVGGSADKQLIEELEEVRKTKEKRIDIVGCTYLDVLRQGGNESPEAWFKNDKKTVLVSPTWGDHGMLSRYGLTLLSALSESKLYNVIVRPHPQSYKVEESMITELRSRFNSDLFYWDSEPDNGSSLVQSDLMISDFSGILFDYILLHKKPVLAFAQEYDKRAKDVIDSPREPWNVQVLKNMDVLISESDIDSIHQIIENRFITFESSTLMIDTIADGMDAYPGKSGVRAVNSIQNILENI